MTKLLKFLLVFFYAFGVQLGTAQNVQFKIDLLKDGVTYQVSMLPLNNLASTEQQHTWRTNYPRRAFGRRRDYAIKYHQRRVESLARHCCSCRKC